MTSLREGWRIILHPLVQSKWSFPLLPWGLTALWYRKDTREKCESGRENPEWIGKGTVLKNEIQCVLAHVGADLQFKSKDSWHSTWFVVSVLFRWSYHMQPFLQMSGVRGGVWQCLFFCEIGLSFLLWGLSFYFCSVRDVSARKRMFYASMYRQYGGFNLSC